MGKHKERRADDKRSPGLGDNVKNTVSSSKGNGSNDPLFDIFNDRRKGKNGSGKRSG